MTDLPDHLLPPVVRSMHLPRPRDLVFVAFTQHIGEWWPPRLTASADILASVVVEGRVGGGVFELDTHGNEVGWGTVLTWQPGRRLVHTWVLGLRAGGPTEVAIDFADVEGGCLLRLEHGGWSAAQAGDRARFADEQGWSLILDTFHAYVTRLADGRPGASR